MEEEHNYNYFSTQVQPFATDVYPDLLLYMHATATTQLCHTILFSSPFTCRSFVSTLRNTRSRTLKQTHAALSGNHSLNESWIDRYIHMKELRIYTVWLPHHTVKRETS